MWLPNCSCLEHGVEEPLGRSPVAFLKLPAVALVTSLSTCHRIKVATGTQEAHVWKASQDHVLSKGRLAIEAMSEVLPAGGGLSVLCPQLFESYSLFQGFCLDGSCVGVPLTANPPKRSLERQRGHVTPLTPPGGSPCALDEPTHTVVSFPVIFGASCISGYCSDMCVELLHIVPWPLLSGDTTVMRQSP